MRNLTAIALALFAGALVFPALAETPPSGECICSKMIADGRTDGMSQDTCLCMFRAAETVLDRDIRALLFDSWLNGTNNMQKLEELPRQARVKRQLTNMKRMVDKDCPGM